MAVEFPTNFDELSIEEKVEFVQYLWDKIAADASDLPLTPEQEAELDRRIRAYEENPSNVTGWDDVKRELLDS